MDEVLMRIFTNGGSSINVSLLKEHTRRMTAKNQIRWESVEHLYIRDRDRDGWLRSDRNDGYYVSYDGSWVLVFGNQAKDAQRFLSGCGEKLSLLDVFADLPGSLDLSGVPNLREISIYALREARACVYGMQHCKKLEKLCVSGLHLTKVLDVSKMAKLQRLIVDDGLLYQYDLCAVTGFEQLAELEHLSIHGTMEMDVLDVSQLRNLRYLGLTRTRKLQRLKGLDLLKNLTYLYLDYVGFYHIPEEIRELKKLECLTLKDMKLDTLPDWLPEMGLPFRTGYGGDGINLYYTTVKDMDMSLFDQPQEVIRQWFADRRKNREGTPLNEIKVVFLGDGEAGKSHTIARLLNDGGDPLDFPGVSTPGIVIQDKHYTIDGREIQVHFWDFGGQEILHSMHRMFLTKRTLYVVLLNARDNKQNDQARYWLHNIKSFAGDAPVLLVLNKMDQNPYASVNENDLRVLYPSLTEVVRMSAKDFTKEQFNDLFTAALLRQIGSFDTIRSPFLPAWSALKSSLQNMTKNYIRGGDYLRLTEECGVTGGEEVRKSLLKWFSDLGVSFCYEGAKLEDYVILRPDWITNAIYIILFNKIDEVRNGLVPHEAIYRLLKPTPDVRRVLEGVEYTPDEVGYVLNVVRKFRLSYQVEQDWEFIPMLCDSNSLPVAEEYAGDPATLEFRMVYAYLPNNVLHRLMVERHRDLDRSQVWLTGARFAHGNTGVSAVVKSEGNLLRIFVRSESARHAPDTYLDMLRDDLERISAEMNLTVEESQVVYKAEGKTAYFDYDEVVGSLRSGMKEIYSKTFKRPIRIEDILGQTDHGVDVARQQLIWDIVRACQKMQDNRDNWDRDEDGRTTYIRDILTEKYVVLDQTRGGMSESGKKAGELDLAIRQERHTPWTIFEAVNIYSANKKDLGNWDDHLKKLLDNYNANGLPFLFHVSYVQCPKDRFNAWCGLFYEHLRFHSPAGYPLQYTGDVRLSPAGYGDNQFIQAARCVYNCDGFPTTVYHLFVHIGQ